VLTPGGGMIGIRERCVRAGAQFYEASRFAAVMLLHDNACFIRIVTYRPYRWYSVGVRSELDWSRPA